MNEIKLSEVFKEEIDTKTETYNVQSDDLMCIGVSTGANWALDTITPKVAIDF